MRMGFARVVPRHITAPPQWIGGWSGCIWARTAEWMPSAPMSSAPRISEVGAVGMLDQHGHAALRLLAVAGHPAAQPDRPLADPLDHHLVEQHVEMAAMHRDIAASGSPP